MTTHTLPDLVPDSKIKLPRQAERTLASGLTVIAIRRPAVPLVELRLRVPFGRAPLPRATLLSQALFTGTSTMSSIDIAAELQTVGGGLSAGLDPDRLLVTGNALAGGLDRMLEILAGVLTDPAYPAEEVATERERLVDHIQVAQSQPAHLARTALLKRMYGRHPYAVQTPEPEQVKAVRPAQLRALHADRVRPDGAVLVLVGDLNPEKAIDAADKALGSWTGPGKDGNVPPTPALETGPLVLVDRPGSVQSSLRMALPAVAAHRPRPRRAAAGQPGLRRLLLVPLGGEHPRGQGLHVRAAHLDRALRRRLRAGRVGRGGDRGDRPGAAGDPVRAGPHRQPPARRGGARAGPPVRPGHAAPGHVHPVRAGRPGQHVRQLRPAPGLPAEHSAALAAATRGAGRRGRRPIPGAVQGGHRGARRRRPDRGAAGRPDRRWNAARNDRRPSSRTSTSSPARSRRWPGPPWTGPRTTARTTPGWPSAWTRGLLLVVDIAGGGRALVRDRADGGAELVLIDTGEAPGRGAAVPRRRPGRHAAVHRGRRRCRRSRAPARPRCAMSGTTWTRGTRASSAPRRRSATGTPRTGSRRGPGCRPRSSRAAGPGSIRRGGRCGRVPTRP